jgi:hypothetical protein
MNLDRLKVPPSKIIVKIKTDDTTIKEEFLIYDMYSTHYDDILLNEIVNITAAKYAGELVDADITITCKITWVKDGKKKD